MESKTKILICTGTTCYVMGGAELFMLEEYLPAEYKGKVDIQMSPCISMCQTQTSGKAPFVKIDDEIISQASISKIIEALDAKIGK